MQQLEPQVDFKGLEKKAWQIRLKLIRMFGFGQAHHFGGSLSAVELVTWANANRVCDPSA
jgi:transketolase N-terminal domain/subunit